VLLTLFAAILAVAWFALVVAAFSPQRVGRHRKRKTKKRSCP